MRTLLLAGGSGGAKLAAGVQAELGAELTVVANTGDDIEVHGVYVSPDPDLCTYWLSGEIDPERGWGIAGDSFTAFERLVELGAEEWFALSDRDLAACLWRRALLDAGARLTEAQAAIAAALGVEASVLPMSDQPVRTRVRTADGWHDFQRYLIQQGAEPAIEQVALEGIEAARPSPELERAVERAEAIVIGPSNPVISIGPILAVPGTRELLEAATAPIVAVSPFVAGRAIKGPTEKFMRAIGEEPSARGVASTYEGLIDGLIVDAADPEDPPTSLPTRKLDTLLDTPERRREVAVATLAFCAELR